MRRYHGREKAPKRIEIYEDSGSENGAKLSSHICKTLMLQEFRFHLSALSSWPNGHRKGAQFVSVFSSALIGGGNQLMYTAYVIWGIFRPSGVSVQHFPPNLACIWAKARSSSEAKVRQCVDFPSKQRWDQMPFVFGKGL